MDTDSFVKSELTHFLRKHSAEASISCIDEIVLSYMVSILEELGSEAAAEDAFDIDQFTEMMEAYLPGFANMNSVEVTEWMFALSTRLERRKSGKDDEQSDNNAGHGSSHKEEGKVEKVDGGQKRTHSTSEREDLASSACTSMHEEDPDKSLDNLEPDMELLMEMFPCACHLEIAHCLAVTKGNVEQAAQLILHRQDAGESILSNSKTSQNGTKKRTDVVVDDKKLKQSILNKYSFIDTHDDKVEHRPVMPKTEPKKLIRYLDNKIVTTKGEKFVEIKKDDDGEVVKKTTVHLKPTRQYRFH